MTDKVIKSVRRVFEILDMFDQERRPLAAKEVSKHLNYPLMSTHALLKSMHMMGYADFDPPSWSYTPSRQFISRLEWAKDYHDRDASVLDLITDLNDTTLETVNLSQRSETQVKIIHGLEGKHPIGVSVKVGINMPITQSLTGITALCALPEDERSAVISKLKNSDPSVVTKADTERFEIVKNELNEMGTVAGYDFFVTGISAVCMPILSPVTSNPLVIGVVGPTDRIRENEAQHRRALKSLAKKHRVPLHFKKTRKVA